MPAVLGTACQCVCTHWDLPSYAGIDSQNQSAMPAAAGTSSLLSLGAPTMYIGLRLSELTPHSIRKHYTFDSLAQALSPSLSVRIAATSHCAPTKPMQLMQPYVTPMRCMLDADGDFNALHVHGACEIHCYATRYNCLHLCLSKHLSSGAPVCCQPAIHLLLQASLHGRFHAC